MKSFFTVEDHEFVDILNQKNTPQPGIFPEGRLHHLVQAACGDFNTERAWHAYARALGNARPNEGEMRIFPLIAHRLGSITPDIPLTNFLKASQRWARMRAIINRKESETIDRLFNDAHIPLIWTKGTALANRIDHRLELRPSGDLDAIIHWEDIDRILELAAQQKWIPRSTLLKNREQARYLNTELSFHLPGGGELDLEWQPRMPFAYDPYITNWIWKTSKGNPDSHHAVFACDTWLLLETLEHGLRANSVYPIRWVVDAVRLINVSQDTIDWSMLLDLCGRYQLNQLLFTGLKILAKYTDNIPDRILNEQKTFRQSILDRAEFQVRLTSPNLVREYRAKMALNRLRREPFHLHLRFFRIHLGSDPLIGFLPRLAIAMINTVVKLITVARKIFFS